MRTKASLLCSRGLCVDLLICCCCFVFSVRRRGRGWSRTVGGRRFGVDIDIDIDIFEMM
jgi:hypothetical protein